MSEREYIRGIYPDVTCQPIYHIHDISHYVIYINDSQQSLGVGEYPDEAWRNAFIKTYDVTELIDKLITVVEWKKDTERRLYRCKKLTETSLYLSDRKEKLLARINEIKEFLNQFLVGSTNIIPLSHEEWIKTLDNDE